MNKIDLTISIVNYKTYDFLHRCLMSIYNEEGNISFEVIMADNEFDESALDLLKRDFQKLKVIPNQQNLFFPHAHNQALAIASGSFFLVCNPDAEIPVGTLRALVCFLDANADIGAVGCRELRPNGEIVATGSRFSKPWMELLENTMLGSFGGLHKLVDQYRLRDWDRNSSRDIDILTNCFLMFRTDLLKQLNGHDERFLLYFTENDICLRIWQAGYRVHFLANCHYIHHGQRSTEQISRERNNEIYERDMLAFYNKHFGRIPTRLMELGFIVMKNLFVPLLRIYRRYRPGARTS